MVPAWVMIICWAYLKLLVITPTDKTAVRAIKLPFLWLTLHNSKTFLVVPCSASYLRFTVPSFSHWAIITPAMERTHGEINSFVHWAIMTRAMERADSEIHSFPHWEIVTRAMERADSEIHSFPPLRNRDPGHGEGRQWDTSIPPLSYHDFVNAQEWIKPECPSCYYHWLRF